MQYAELCTLFGSSLPKGWRMCPERQTEVIQLQTKLCSSLCPSPLPPAPPLV